jgi:hypothetical protein
MGQSFQNLGQNIQENVWMGRRMNQQDMQFQQEMAQQQTQFQQGFALKKAEADMQLQLQAQEQQMNMYKLQQMAAIDAVDMSQIQKDRARMENHMMKLGIQEQERKMQEYDGLGRQARLAEVMNKMDPYYLATIGYAVDPQTAQVQPFKDQATQQTVLENMRMMRGRAMGLQDTSSMDTRRDVMSITAIQSQMNQLRELLADPVRSQLMDDNQKRQIQQDLQLLQQQRDQLLPQDQKQATARPDPEAAPKVGQPDPKAAPQAADPNDYSSPVLGSPRQYTQQDKDLLQRWTNNIGVSGDTEINLEEPTRKRVAKFLLDNQDDLYAVYQQGAQKGREGNVLDKDTYLNNVISSLNPGSNASYRNNVLAVLVRNGIITVQDAQQIAGGQ